MNRGRRTWIAGVGVAIGVAITSAVGGVASAASPTVPADFCARVSPGVVAGAIAVPELVEVSGLAASRTYPGVLWANNDSGDGPRLFAMSDVGASLGVYGVPGAEAIDWEDIATGPGPDPATAYIYIADIGDNGASRDHVSGYRVAEPASPPAGSDGTLDGAEAIQLAFPEGPADAEALLVDPLTGDLFIITKDLFGVSRVLRGPEADLSPSGLVTMEEVGTLVRTDQQVLAFGRAEGETVGEALAGTPCSAPQLAEPQGEGSATVGAPTTAANVASTATDVATLQSTAPIVPSALPPPTSPPANRWWIWSGIAAGLIAVGAFAVIARRLRPRGGLR